MAKEDKNKSTNEPSVKDPIFGAESTEEFFSTIGNNKESGNSRESSPDSGDKGGNETVESQIAELKKEIETVGKRYGDSSKEAIRLKEELNQLEPFIPIFNEMKENPDLVNTLKREIESKEEPKSAKEALGLKDDFEFNAEEAVSDINSDSARVLRYMGKVEAEKTAAKARQQNERQRASDMQKKDFDSFVENAKLDKDQTNALKTYMAEHELNLNDVYYLMNRENFAKEIAKRSREETLKQIEKAQSMNGDALSTRESIIRDTKDDDKFFDSVFGEREKGIFG